MPRFSYADADLPVELAEYFSQSVKFTNTQRLHKFLKKLDGAVVNIVNETALSPVDPLNPLSPLAAGNTLNIVLPAETTEKSIIAGFHDFNTTCSFLQSRQAHDKIVSPDRYTQCSYSFCTKPKDAHTCFMTVFYLLKEHVSIDRYVQSKMFDFEQIGHDGSSFFGYSAVAMSDLTSKVTGFSEWMLQTPITTFIDALRATVENYTLFGLRLSDTAVAHIVRRLDVALSYQNDFLSVTTSYERMKADMARGCSDGVDVDAFYKVPSFVWDGGIFMLNFYSDGVQRIYGLNRRGVQHQAQKYLQEHSRDRDSFLDEQLPRESGSGSSHAGRASVRERASGRTWPGITQMEMDRATFSYHERNRLPGMLDLMTVRDSPDSPDSPHRMSRPIRHTSSGFQ